ncbi:MAG: uridine kinase [Clostridia bacterium]|nr:uridine kinase [Clostridia bacterium]
METLLIGIAGGTGSGKTTVTCRIAETFAGEVCVIYHDNYYRAHDELTYEERAKLNYDHPDAFDTPLFLNDLKALKAGRTVECPVYDYSAHNRSKDETVRIEPKRIIVADGILIFYEKELRELFDIKIFIDTDADVRILRRLMRDVSQRGRTVESVVTQYLTTVKPMHEQFVEPTKRYADVIIPEGGRNPVALEMLFSRIRQHMGG